MILNKNCAVVSAKYGNIKGIKKRSSEIDLVVQRCRAITLSYYSQMEQLN